MGLRVVVELRKCPEPNQRSSTRYDNVDHLQPSKNLLGRWDTSFLHRSEPEHSYEGLSNTGGRQYT